MNRVCTKQHTGRDYNNKLINFFPVLYDSTLHSLDCNSNNWAWISSIFRSKCQHEYFPCRLVVDNIFIWNPSVGGGDYRAVFVWCFVSLAGNLSGFQLPLSMIMTQTLDTVLFWKVQQSLVVTMFFFVCFFCDYIMVSCQLQLFVVK